MASPPFPTEILSRIFLFSSPSSILVTFPLVCRRWRDISFVVLDSEGRIPLEIEFRPEESTESDKGWIRFPNNTPFDILYDELKVMRREDRSLARTVGIMRVNGVVTSQPGWRNVLFESITQCVRGLESDGTIVPLIKRSQSATSFQASLSKWENSVMGWTTFLAKRGLCLFLTSVDFSFLLPVRKAGARINMDQTIRDAQVQRVKISVPTFKKLCTFTSKPLPSVQMLEVTSKLEARLPETELAGVPFTGIFKVFPTLDTLIMDVSTWNKLKLSTWENLFELQEKKLAQIKMFQCIENGTHISLASLSECAELFSNLSDVGVISFAQECLEPRKHLLKPAPNVKILRVDLDITVRLGHAWQMLGEQFASAVALALPGLRAVHFSVDTSIAEHKAKDIIVAAWVKIGEVLPAVSLCFHVKRGQGRRVWREILRDVRFKLKEDGKEVILNL